MQIVGGSAQSRTVGITLMFFSALAAPIGAAAAESDTPIAAGNNFACALTAQGGVKCWGNNFFGQLGDGTTTNQPIPVRVRPLTSGVNSVAAGNGHACALTGAGGVKCWGDNQFGQLGNGSTTESHRPVNVRGLTRGVTAIAAGGDHTCALLENGRVKCWGYNAVGDLGDGSIINRDTPVTVSGLRGATAIAAGSLHTCAVTRGGAAECWGKDDSGQLGDGRNLQQMTPVRVARLRDAVSLTAGSGHTCALLNTGAVDCWGANQYGQLGDGTTRDRNKPVAASTLILGARLLALGPDASQTCVVTQSFRVMCWGRNDTGQVGDGTTTNRKAAVQVPRVVAVNIAAGAAHTCARAQSGAVQCWGANMQGELGNGTFVDSPNPVRTKGF